MNALPRIPGAPKEATIGQLKPLYWFGKKGCGHTLIGFPGIGSKGICLHHLISSDMTPMDEIEWHAGPLPEPAAEEHISKCCGLPMIFSEYGWACPCGMVKLHKPQPPPEKQPSAEKYDRDIAGIGKQPEHSPLHPKPWTYIPRVHSARSTEHTIRDANDQVVCSSIFLTAETLIQIVEAVNLHKPLIALRDAVEKVIEILPSPPNSSDPQWRAWCDMRYKFGACSTAREKERKG